MRQEVFQVGTSECSLLPRLPGYDTRIRLKPVYERLDTWIGLDSPKGSDKSGGHSMRLKRNGEGAEVKGALAANELRESIGAAPNDRDTFYERTTQRSFE